MKGLNNDVKTVPHLLKTRPILRAENNQIVDVYIMRSKSYLLTNCDRRS